MDTQLVRCHQCNGTCIFERHGTEVVFYHSCWSKEQHEGHDRLTRENAELRAQVERLTETYTDEAGSVWAVPTAYAYARACIALKRSHRPPEPAQFSDTEILDWLAGEQDRINDSYCFVGQSSPCIYVIANVNANKSELREAISAAMLQSGVKSKWYHHDPDADGKFCGVCGLNWWLWKNSPMCVGKLRAAEGKKKVVE